MAFTTGQEVLILPSLKKWIEDQAWMEEMYTLIGTIQTLSFGIKYRGTYTGFTLKNSGYFIPIECLEPYGQSTKEERILKKIAYLDNKWKEQQREKAYNLSLQHEEQKCTPTIISPSDQTSIPKQSLQTTPNRSSGQLGRQCNPFMAFSSTWAAYRA
jgi:hypothetical protein